MGPEGANGHNENMQYTLYYQQESHQSVGRYPRPGPAKLTQVRPSQAQPGLVQPSPTKCSSAWLSPGERSSFLAKHSPAQPTQPSTSQPGQPSSSLLPAISQPCPAKPLLAKPGPAKLPSASLAKPSLAKSSLARLSQASLA